MNFDAELPSAISLARPAVTRILCFHSAEVDDVLQEAAVRAWISLDRFRKDCKFSTWYTRIAIRQALIHLRRARGKYKGALLTAASLEGVVMADLAPGPRELAEGEELERILREEVARLSPAQQEEAGKLLAGDRSEYSGTVRKAHRFRLRERLRVALARRGVVCES